MNSKNYLLESFNDGRVIAILILSGIVTSVMVKEILYKKQTYKLCKEFKNHKKTVGLPACIENIKREDPAHDVDVKFDAFVNLFIKTIDDKLPHINSSLLNQNLKTFNIKEKFKIYFKMLHMGNAIAAYKSDSNIAYVRRNKFIHCIFHEFFHMASTYSEKEKCYCGFAQHYKKSENDIGYGLNEGYTSLLTKRYFKDYYEEDGYEAERIIASMVEKIIGKEYMEKMYFGANLKGIVEGLKEYSSEEEAIEFILDIDFINMASRKNNPFFRKIIKKRLLKITDYLSQCYSNKILSDYHNNKIDYITAIRNIASFPLRLALHIKDTYNGQKEEVDKFIYNMRKPYVKQKQL
jgi:hypothetical protein